jgi:hypothetical protein
MDPGYRTPLVDFFRRGEVARDVRELAARGVLAPAAHEQLALLLLLVDDPDPHIAQLAAATVDRIPREALAAFLARSDVPEQMRAFFRARGIEPAAVAAPDASAPLVEAPDDPLAGPPSAEAKMLSALPVPEKLKLAMKGSREQRAVLIRDPNKIVAVAVLSSPKLTETEVESFARMVNVSDEVLRTIGTNRAWLRNYAVVAALAKNPKTPPSISLSLIQRLTERDIKALLTDRNVPEAVRIAARKVAATTEARRR